MMINQIYSLLQRRRWKQRQNLASFQRVGGRCEPILQICV